jgi:hypothetical protein
VLHDRSAIVGGTDLRSLADDLLGAHAGGQRNPTWRCPNPNHAQTGRTPPVSVFYSHRGEQRWRCHGCGMGGTAIDLVVVARNVNVVDALAYLSDRQRNGPAPVADARWQQEQRPPARPDPQGIARYVDDCARRLWRPEGRAVREWLTRDRGLDPEVLRVNRIGADAGPRTQSRPRGIPRAAGAVLTALDPAGAPVYAQLRLLRPRGDQPRYLNPAAGLLANPRLTHVRPPEVRRRPVLVTEGAIDALTAASAGYRAVAILGAGYPDDLVAGHLARIAGPIVLAFDPDVAGTVGGDRLAGLLAARHRPALRLPAGPGDLNDRRIAADGDWPRRLDDLVAAAIPATSAETATSDRGFGVA